MAKFTTMVTCITSMPGEKYKQRGSPQLTCLVNSSKNEGVMAKSEPSSEEVGTATIRQGWHLSLGMLGEAEDDAVPGLSGNGGGG